MADLAEWLLAQIAEDERMATRAARFKYDRPSDAPWEVAKVQIAAGAPMSSSGLIAMCSPARVLAECDSKRRIITEYSEDDSTYEEAVGAHIEHERILRLLALPYADRDGYDESWRLDQPGVSQ